MASPVARIRPPPDTQADVETTLAPRTYNKNLSILKDFFQWQVKRGRLVDGVTNDLGGRSLSEARSPQGGGRGSGARACLGRTRSRGDLTPVRRLRLTCR